MPVTTDVNVIIKNSGEENHHTFENETLLIQRATKLWIHNKSDGESNFFESIKVAHQVDKGVKNFSSYIIKTSEPTAVQSFREYYVSKIDEENQVITFEWHEL